MNDKQDQEPRSFKCPHCKERFHIRKFKHHKWAAYMPPDYCPACGREMQRSGDGE